MDQARLKYRIVGGIVLVALAAILVPVLNDMRQPLSHGPQAIDIPAEPTDGIASRLPVDAPPVEGNLPEPQDISVPAAPPPLSDDGDVVPPDRTADLAPPAAVTRPAPVTPPRTPPLVAEPVPAPPVVASKPQAVRPVAPAAPKPAPVAPKPAPVAKPPAAAPAPASQQAWVVQLGVFGNLKTAIDLRERLRKAGHSAFTEEITTPQGKALRVRVGPELDRAKARALRDRLAAQTGQEGIVVAYP